MVQKFSRKNRQYRAIRDKIFYGLFVFCTLIGVLGLATLLIDVFLDGYQWVNIDFITNYASRFPDQSGILALALIIHAANSREVTKKLSSQLYPTGTGCTGLHFTSGRAIAVLCNYHLCTTL